MARELNFGWLFSAFVTITDDTHLNKTAISTRAGRSSRRQDRYLRNQHRVKLTTWGSFFVELFRSERGRLAVQGGFDAVSKGDRVIAEES